MNTIAFNTAAKTELGDRAKIRIANIDGALRVRPTNRKAGANLPKGQKLIDLAGSRVTLPEGMDLPSGKYSLHADKYGWFALEPGAQGRGPQVTIA